MGECISYFSIPCKNSRSLSIFKHNTVILTCTVYPSLSGILIVKLKSAKVLENNSFL